MAQGTCSVDGCYRRAKCRGWCMTHYNRIRRYGDPNWAPKSPDRPHFKIDPETGCWEWARALMAGTGYGAHLGRPAHRAYWELVYGKLPEGIQIDHLCRNRVCVNPAHLEPVTPQENQRRGFGPSGLNARKTHCIHGHPFDEANTYHPPDRPWCRACRACASARQKRKATQ